MDRNAFVARFGGVFEHSPWIAERAFDASGMPSPLSAQAVHPDLAGKLAVAGQLTEDSRAEQKGAGLDRLTETEFARFTDLNTRYQSKFGFPFIIAVKGLDKDDILAAFERRIHNSRLTEFDTAAHEVEKIARLRLEAMGW
jgi:2-oxo-4-hydroxy-4-carboxy-5-ureidoimidazoline decarboxylase